MPRRALLWITTICCSLSLIQAHAATSTTDWRNEQQFAISAPGIVKLSLSPETLDKARPGLEDLRLYDDTGSELPYLIERPAPAIRASQNAQSFHVSLTPSATVIDIETGLNQPINSITLETPAAQFIKAVQIDGTSDGASWRTLAQGQPIFRQNGASQLQIAIPVGVWKQLKLTVDDQRSEAIPFRGAQIHAASAQPAPSEPVSVTIKERNENPGETRLTLDLGAANLNLSTLQIETDEPLFTRQVTVAVPQIVENVIREQPIAQSAIYRVAIEGQPASASLQIPLETQVPTHELLLLIKNNDSPPLSIKTVRAERRPVYLTFLAHHAGTHHLFTGNNGCPAPSYDLAAMGASLKNVALTPIQLSPLKDNPDYRAPEALPGVQEEGVPLDTSNWAARKTIKLNKPGAQEIELDLDVLSHSDSNFQDLRLLHNGIQLPYIFERTSITRLLKPAVTITNDARDPGLTRWIFHLSHSSLPVTRLTCNPRTQLFQRNVTLYENVIGSHGEKYRRPLGSANWVQTPGHTSRELTLNIEASPETDTLVMETHNGDNPPILLENFQVSYPVTRVLFKAKSQDSLFLYYNNPQATTPRYDLSLMAAQLLAAEKNKGELGPEDRLKKASWAAGQAAGKGGVIFWGILALVVVVLLIVISRLLPKPSESEK